MNACIKFFAFLLLIFTATEAIAQKRTISVRAGVNYSSVTFEDDNFDYNDNITPVAGSHIGVLGQFQIRNRFTIETGLIINSRGWFYDDSATIGGVLFELEETCTSYYLDIPVTLRQSFRWRRSQLYGIIGPYFSYGFGGTIKTDLTVGGVKTSDNSDIEWGTDANSDLKPFDMGLTLGIGYTFKRISVGVNYDMGFANIAADTNNGEVINNNSLNLNVSYNFGRW